MALIKCPDCGSDVSDAAPACPKCGRPIATPAKVAAQKAPPKKHGCGTLIVLIVMVGTIAWVINVGKNGSPADAPERPAEAPRPIYSTSASQLFNDYDRNEVAADEAMKGRVIQVYGRIQAVDKDFRDSVVINLATPNQFMPARLYMADDQKAMAAGLAKGQQVTIQCQRMSRIVGSPSGTDCRFIP